MKNLNLLLLAAGTLLFAACTPRAYYVTALAPGPVTASQPVTAAVPTDSAAEQFIRPYRRRVVREMREVIGTSGQAWLKPGKLGTNAPLTVWIAGVLRVEAGRALGQTPDFTVLTNGSVRAGLPQGNITLGNIFEIMPFENELTVLPVPGPVVRQLCDYAGKYNNVAAVGLTWATDSATTRARDIRVGGQPLDTTRTYSLAINDYLANGGDGMDFLRPLPQTPARRTIRQVLLDYVRREHLIAPLPASLTPSPIR
ncbi:MAG: 5'-nucleotidase C-terminal domain-containing protein [Hymenobacteraceae bacterium]|nr:5'-nucleotidase C-terminal domain-containing protein [Hymenobacteraceae bacterium]